MFSQRLSLFLLALTLSSCSNPPEKQALEFAKTNNYNLLSERDKSVYSEKKFNEIWSSVYKLQLEPTSEYYLLEKYLNGLIRHQVKSVETLDKKTKVVVLEIYPKVLSDFLLGIIDTNLLGEDTTQKLVNFNALHKKGLIDTADIKFLERELSFDVYPDGVFIDLAEIKKKIEKSDSIKSIIKPVDEILDLEKITNISLLMGDTQDDFNTLMEFAKGIDEDIQKVESIQKLVKEVDPEYDFWFFEQYLTKAREVSVLEKKFNHLKRGLRFRKLNISRSDDGELALFGNYVYTGSMNVKIVHGLASFYDDNGVVIYKQEFKYLLSDLFEGKEGSIGKKLADQYVAGKTVRVTIEPFAIR